MVEKFAKIDKYRLEKFLGKGYNSKVKLAVDMETEERYAIKIVRHSDSKFNPKLLRAEFEILFQHNNPNIVKMIQLFEETEYIKKNGKSYKVTAIVMEFVSGGMLFEFIINRKFSEEVTRTYFQMLIETLEYCHETLKIAHRDLKTENLLLDENFNLKIADFGFATSMAGKDGSGLLSTPLGTAGYKAPEIHEGLPYVGSSADLFAAGVILFLMFTRSQPFQSSQKSDKDYRMLQTNPEEFWKKFLRLRVYYGPEFSFSDEFKDLSRSLLAFKPEERLTIQQVKAHPWYKGPVVKLEDLKAEFIQRKKIVEEEIKKKYEKAKKWKQIEKQLKEQEESSKDSNFFRSIRRELESEIDSELELRMDFKKQRRLKDYVPSLKLRAELFTAIDPQTLFKIICSLVKKYSIEFVVDKDIYKIKGKAMNDEGNFTLDILLTKLDDDLTCVEFHKKSGELIPFCSIVTQIKKDFSEIDEKYGKSFNESF